MITLQEYVGPWAASPDWTPERQRNAANLLNACAALEADMVADGVVFPDHHHTGAGMHNTLYDATDDVSGQTYGGFRPQDCPIGAAGSSHKEGLAVDRYDPHGDIDSWLMDHQDYLKLHGIYIEHPAKTVGWSHWSIHPPKSGLHVFWP